MINVLMWLEDRALDGAISRRAWVRWLSCRWLGMDPRDPWRR